MANQKVTREDVMAALNQVGGCVAHAADLLCVTRRTIYKKARRLGIDLGIYRDQSQSFTAHGVQTRTVVGVGPVSVAVVGHVDTGEPNSDGGHFPAGDSGRSLQVMIERGATVEGSAALDRLAAHALGGSQAPRVRLCRPLQDRVQRIRLAAQARLGRDLSGSMILDDLVAKYVDDYERELFGHELAVVEPKR